MSQLSLDEQYQRMRSACQDVSALVDHMRVAATNEELDQMLSKADALIGHYMEEAEQYRRLLQRKYLEKLQAESKAESNDEQP